MAPVYYLAGISHLLQWTETEIQIAYPSIHELKRQSWEYTKSKVTRVHWESIREERAVQKAFRICRWTPSSPQLSINQCVIWKANYLRLEKKKNLPNQNWENNPQAHIETGIIHSTTRQNSKILEITMDQVGYSKDTVSVPRQN